VCDVFAVTDSHLASSDLMATLTATFHASFLLGWASVVRFLIGELLGR
jgi:hypothetical protein